MVPFAGTVWRIMFADHAEEPLAPARAPEGRFHYDDQVAIYTSLTAEGAGVAIQRYLEGDTWPRVIVPLTVTADNVLDLRGDTRGIPPTSIVWQDDRAAGRRAPTWDISDAARAEGAQGILYASRTRPDLSHLVLLGHPGPGVLTQAAAGRPWP